MSTHDTPSRPPADGQPDRPGHPARRAGSGGGARTPTEADFDLMLALRGAAHARDLRNRVVRPRRSGSTPTDVPDPAHPGRRSGYPSRS